ncbi:MAG: tRNA 2-thiouridine(34) synthase MnmA [candidate division WOR-3 bacterium]|nr:tRNA 2-thiouridine(34) synthase MnmA [candidate division WOR-3 bacterium]
MKVLVALSGGVDSSTAAALLKQSGYDVAGATMQFRGVDEEDIELAKNVCEILDIEFHLFDFSQYYQKTIIENFINEYKSGRTPNPCVLCNKLIKFGLFLKKAQEMGFDMIATGHYARIVTSDGLHLLKRGKDKNEQSYFLYRLNQSQLSKLFLPLGDYTKEEVREIARKFKLPAAHRKKSQDVCFLPDIDYTTFLKDIVSIQKGPIYDKDGKKIGEHKGIFNYTWGQRRRIGISGKEPYYVIKIDPVNNAIYVGKKQDVYKKSLIAEDLNFIIPIDVEKPLKVQAKVRYVAPLSPATVCIKDKTAEVYFDKPQWAITPGQSVVFYKDDTVLGGGIISEVLD